MPIPFGRDHFMPERLGAPALVVLSQLLGCGSGMSTSVPREVIVTGIDYSFQLPDTLRAGPTAFRFHNAGQVPHEMALAVLRPGVSLDSLSKVMAAGGSPDSLVESLVGILIAPPGATPPGTLVVDLIAGRSYVFGCQFQDAPDKPPHVAMGMLLSRPVVAGT